MDNAGETAEYRFGHQENLLRAAGKEDELGGFSLRQGSHDWASNREAPRASTAAARLLSHSGETVLASIAVAPLPRPASAPVSAVIQTALEASSSVNMLKTNSAPSAASRGVAADLAPRATAAVTAAG
jgi:hypothetical protein